MVDNPRSSDADAQETAGVSASSPLTEKQLRQWLRTWVASTTEQPEEDIADTTPLVSLGLSSRDAVVLSGELENLIGRRIDATVAYEYPTIAALAGFLVSASEQEEPQHNYARYEGGARGHDIAIIGYSVRFPGGETNEEFWKMLVESRTVTGPLPAGRWTEYSADPEMSKKLEELNTDGGYLSDIASFDNEFFGLSPLEAENMDPQQRIMLEEAWHAFEDAHLPPNTLRGQSVGVFIGSTSNDYGLLIASDPANAHPYALTGTSSSIIPNRISYALDLRGPSLSIDTACSSSLVAVHEAVRSLRDGSSDVALAGGVNILASPFISTSFAQLGVISPTGAIHAFSDDADGFVRAEGAGAFVLKRVEDAMADGDNILAVIKGSAVNSDGHSNGITAPNPDAQVDVLRRAYADAGIDPSSIDYVEAHGTGTILGDPIEASALGEVLGQGRSHTNPLLLGSAKTNVGHSESAAGSASLAKVIEAMRQKTVPANVNFAGPNRYIDFDAQHLEVVEDPREWPNYSGRMTAGVSGFGFGGTNAHVVVSEFRAEDYEDKNLPEQTPLFHDPEDANAVLLPVSGLLPSRRKKAAAQLADFIETQTNDDLPAIARSLAGRNHGRSRAVVAANTTEDAVKLLRRVADGKVTAGIASADSPSEAGPVFVYSGFGSQHRKMGKALLEMSPYFKQRIEELDAYVDFESGWSIVDIMADDEQTYNTETAQVAITAMQIALTDLLAQLGIRPAGVMGMSMGEIAAAYAAGGISDSDAMLIACHRARLMGEGEQMLAGTENEGAMAVVELTREQLAQFNEDHPEIADIEPAVYAGPGMTTVGGKATAVDVLVAELEEAGKFARKMTVKGAGHTSELDPILGELAVEISRVEGRPLSIPLYSSVDRGQVHAAGTTVHGADYFLKMTREPVWFEDSTKAALAAGHTTLVEISPNPVALMGMMNTAFSVGMPDAQLLFALKRKEDEAATLRDLIAKLYVAGMPVDFTHLLGAGELKSAPKTAFNQQKFWTNARPGVSSSAALPGTKVTLPDNAVGFSTTADRVPSALALMEAAAENLSPGAQLVAQEELRDLPRDGELTTMVERTLAGLNISVYEVAGEKTTLVAQGFASTLAFETPATTQEEAPAPSLPAGISPTVEVDTIRWDPASGESVEDRLRAIVSESMGYDVDDLPGELPLIDLGLDSLMGMRIKNRVENDFQIPPLNVQMLRDASVADVVRIVTEAVEGRETTDAPAKQEKTESAQSGIGVAPRDAAERAVFGTWAKVTGAAAHGVTSPLPEITDEQAQEIAATLQERSGMEFSAEQFKEAETLEPLADRVREGLETPVEGNVRVLRARPEGSTQPAVFMFHPAGGTTVVYEPLTRRLPEDVPVYGIERVEGNIEDRVAGYLDDIEKYAEGFPVVLGGWSFGGALAYEAAHQLVDKQSVEVALIALLDTTQPAEPAPDTPEETRARWERYAAFAKKTYGLDFEVPYELLDTAGEEALLTMLEQFLATTDASEHGLSAGVLEHQRASFVDNRILASLNLNNWADVKDPVLLFRSERMHDGAIELEPTYANIAPDGGWGQIVEDLSIVQLPGDHLAVPDEPAIGIVAKHLMEKLEGK